MRALASLPMLALLCSMGCGGGSSSGPGTALTPGTVDFGVDASAIADSAEVVEITFAADDCEVLGGTVAAPGKRRLLRFDTVVMNLGDQPCVIGDPANPRPPIDPSAFEFDACHGHYHLDGFASYELRHLDGTIAAIGHKQSFCITDSLPVANELPSAGFDCSFQGLSPGWADLYARGVPGQWIDVSGVPGGDYEIVVTVNPTHVLPELNDVVPDTVRVPFHLPDPSAAVAQLDDHSDTPGQATEMPIPAGFEATLLPAGDVDWFRLRLHAGVTYAIRTELLTLPDSRLRVYDAGGVVLLAENDDAAPGDPSSAILYLAPSDGDVTVEVTGPGGGTGTYRLHADEVP